MSLKSFNDRHCRFKRWSCSMLSRFRLLCLADSSSILVLFSEHTKHFSDDSKHSIFFCHVVSHGLNSAFNNYCCYNLWLNDYSTKQDNCTTEHIKITLWTYRARLVGCWVEPGSQLATRPRHARTRCLVDWIDFCTASATDVWLAALVWYRSKLGKEYVLRLYLFLFKLTI